MADIGLLYSNNEYDRELYSELKEISHQLLREATGLGKEDIKIIFPETKDYPTVKVDIRGIALNEEKKILLVRESKDGKWALPGGWADVGFTPSETVVKEFKEETGFNAKPTRLLAVFDKRKHHHPPQPFYVYKMVFQCEIISGAMQKGFDILDVQFFSVSELPELSEDRILSSQIQLLHKKILSNDSEVYYD